MLCQHTINPVSVFGKKTLERCLYHMRRENISFATEKRHQYGCRKSNYLPASIQVSRPFSQKRFKYFTTKCSIKNISVISNYHPHPCRTLCASVPSLKIETGCSSLKGRAKENEDKFAVANLRANILYSGVFDGHNGNFVSKYANKNIPKRINEKLDDKEFSLYDNVFETIDLILKNSFQTCQDNLAIELLASDIQRKDMVGSTGVVCLLIDQKYLSVANVGDSKAILCRNGAPLQLSIEHNAENKEEALRIQKSGGTIDWDTRMKPYVNSRLSITRSFGNMLLKNQGVIYEPSISNIVVDEVVDSFLVLCSDGITHAINDDEIVFIVSQHDNAIDAAEDLTNTAQQYGSTDDCTAVVIPLPAWRCVDVKMPVAVLSHFRTMTGGRSSG